MISTFNTIADTSRIQRVMLNCRHSLSPKCNGPSLILKGSRAAIKDHLSKEQLQHTTMMTDRISSVETNVQRIENATTTMKEALDNQGNNYREELTTFRDDLAALRVAVDNLQTTLHEIEEGAREPQGAEAAAARPDENQDLKTRLERLEDQMKQIQLRGRQALSRGQVEKQHNNTWSARTGLHRGLAWVMML
jgi:DNA repair exonuclease SbcCD ATPase subunit